MSLADQAVPSRSAALCFSVLLLVVTISLAQNNGVITGKAVDTGGAVLQGARVELQPGQYATVTDSQGEFRFMNVPPGNYRISVSYVGFTAFTSDVEVGQTKITRVNATLRVATKNEEVMVYAERPHGEAEAINRVRTSDNILQVLPVEVITSLPNTNIADALGRLPSVTLERDEGEGKYVQIRGTEPRLSNVTVNGVVVPSPESSVRQIKLDVIPANLVESVEINKTLSANQDADAIGGSVNLVTKRAEDKPTLYLNGIGGYTPIIGGRALTELDGTVGKRFGANKKFGALIGGSFDWNGRGIDDVEPSVGTNDFGGTLGVQPVVSSTDIREYRYYRERYGLTGSLDYKLGDISGLYLRFIYSHFNNFGERWVYSPSVNSFLTPDLSGPDSSVSFNSQIRRPVEVIGSVDIGGKHVFSKWVLAYEAAVARSSSEDHGYSTGSFSGPSGSDTNPLVFAIDRSNPLRPKLIPQNGFNIYDPTTYTLNGGDSFEVSKTYSPQVNIEGSFSAARNYKIGSHFGTFEFGGKIRNAHKFEDAIDNLYNGNGPDNLMSMNNFLSSFTNPSYYGGSYTLGPVTDFNKIRSFFWSNSGFFSLDPIATAQSTFPNDYDLNERISAGFLMNTLEFGRVRLQTGVRFEGTTEDLTGNQVVLSSIDGSVQSVQPLTRNNSYLDVLPSVQARVALWKDGAIRAVYGQGIARPNFGDLPPFFVRDDQNNKIDVGNPDLKPTHSHNYDLLYEQYLNPLGLIQAGVFYKQLSDPIYVVNTTITSGPFAGFTQTQPVNGAHAHLLGFEIAYQQHLRFLPGPMSGLGIAANYSYTTSRASGVDPNRTDSPALLRQAPNTWNISPTYDRGRVSMRMGISHNDANIFQYNFQDGAPLGRRGPNGDVYLYAHTQVDAQASVHMYRGLQFIVSGLNLTNEVFGFYQGSPIYPIQREYYKPTYSFGLRYSLTNERN